MSHTHYDREWSRIHEIFSATLQLEPNQADRRLDRPLLATLYVRYKTAANQLSPLVDQIVQPQKLRTVRKLLDALLGRILELKYDLVEADLNEWTHVGDTLERLRIVPDAAELKIPDCYRNARVEELVYRDRLIDSTLATLGYRGEETKRPRQLMSEQQAIAIIQTHERARQGRLRAQFMREIRANVKEKMKPPSSAAGGGDGLGSGGGISLNAALRIQKIWRGYVARRATRRRKLQEMLLIGRKKGRLGQFLGGITNQVS